MFVGHDWGKARKIAQDNANYFGVRFELFADTSGNLRVERYRERSQRPSWAAGIAEVFHPKKKEVK